MSVGKASIKRAIGAKETVAAPKEEPKVTAPAEEKAPAKKPAAKKPAAKKPAPKREAKKPAAKSAPKATPAPANDTTAACSLGDALPYYLL